MSRDDHPTPSLRLAVPHAPRVSRNQSLYHIRRWRRLWPTPPWLRTHRQHGGDASSRVVVPRVQQGRCAGKPALCRSFPSCKKGLEGPDTVRTLATRHGILIGDGSVHAAGPKRDHGESRLSDTCSDLRSPNGVRTRVSTLRVFPEPIPPPAAMP